MTGFARLVSRHTKHRQARVRRRHKFMDVVQELRDIRGELKSRAESEGAGPVPWAPLACAIDWRISVYLLDRYLGNCDNL